MSVTKASPIATQDPERLRHPMVVSLSPVEVARLLSLSRSSIDRLLARGELASFKVGNARRVRVQDLEQYIANELNS